MNIRHQTDDQPTDMMCRRTPLPFRECFLWLGTVVTIRTDSPAILKAAEGAGLVPQRQSEQEPGMRWEIVGEQRGTTVVEDWECEVTLDTHSLYLGMSAEQWFAFDLKTGDGAGFVVVSDNDRLSDLNAELYLRAIADNI